MTGEKGELELQRKGGLNKTKLSIVLLTLIILILVFRTALVELMRSFLERTF